MTGESAWFQKTITVKAPSRGQSWLVAVVD